MDKHDAAAATCTALLTRAAVATPTTTRHSWPLSRRRRSRASDHDYQQHTHADAEEDDATNTSAPRAALADHEVIEAANIIGVPITIACVMSTRAHNYAQRSSYLDDDYIEFSDMEMQHREWLEHDFNEYYDDVMHGTNIDTQYNDDFWDVPSNHVRANCLMKYFAECHDSPHARRFIEIIEEDARRLNLHMARGSIYA